MLSDTRLSESTGGLLSGSNLIIRPKRIAGAKASRKWAFVVILQGIDSQPQRQDQTFYQFNSADHFRGQPVRPINLEVFQSLSGILIKAVASITNSAQIPRHISLAQGSSVIKLKQEVAIAAMYLPIVISKAFGNVGLRIEDHDLVLGSFDRRQTWR